MPISQGGKHPDGLAGYRPGIESDDYMLAVASWVDSDPDMAHIHRQPPGRP